MKISTKGRYALRMLLDLAQHTEQEYVPLKDIAERQNLSKKYLEQIVPVLNKSEMLQTNERLSGRLPTGENAGCIHRRRDTAAYRGQSGSCGVSGG